MSAGGAILRVRLSPSGLTACLPACRRAGWWGHRPGTVAHSQASSRVRASRIKSAKLDDAALYASLKSGPQGLDPSLAARRQQQFGPNQVEPEKALSWPAHLWQAYANPFSLLLTVLAAVSWATHDLRSALVIATMVLLSTGLRIVQERRSNRCADALRAMVSSHACLLRPGQPPCEVPMATLVPGDVVRLAAGDMIPADCRVMSATDLFINQAAMTGEALPVEKRPGPRDPAPHTDPLSLDNLAFMGSNVVSGSATVLLLATGPQTFFGELAQQASQTSRAPTQFQSGVNRVSWLLIRFMAVMVPLVLLINGFGKGDWTQAFLFALSIAVGLTPEMLPMIVTSTLAKGAMVMSQRKVIVKRLDAIQNFGAMDVLCTDKTGTLTQDHVVLKQHIDVLGDDSDQVLRLVYLNSRFQTGLRNLLDAAVLEHTDLKDWSDSHTMVDEIPFDFERRRMSVVVRAGDGQPPQLICKGAFEEVLAQCTTVVSGGTTLPLDAALVARIQATVGALNDDGMRVIAVAVRDMPADRTGFHPADEVDMCLAGFVAFLDPPKETAAPALAALARHGLTVKVLTGDNERVTRKVCRDVGLVFDRVVLGSEVELMDETALAASVRTHDIYAKLAPHHKERIVVALRANGHVVGYLGDGINDAPALHAADIGISVDSGTDIAKEVADLILLEKSLLVLDEGVIEGRKTFANMLKYIRMTASSNFGNVLSVLVASAALPFLPMLPMHLLVQNLLYDFSQVPIPFDSVDEEVLSRPMRWQPAEIGRFMLFFGPLSSVFDLATFALLWFVFGAQTLDQQTLFQSGWFIEGLLTQTLVVHLIRTDRIPFIQSRAAPSLLFTSALVMTIGLWLPMGPLAPWLRMQPLPWTYFGWLALFLLGYATLVQTMKRVWRGPAQLRAIQARAGIA